MILVIFTALFAVSFATFSLMMKLPLCKNKLLRSLLYVSARKSNSDAILLGGLVLNITTMIAIILATPLFREDIIAQAATIAFSIILIHGFLDDKYEISPKAKLLSQLISVGIFAIAAASQLSIDPLFVLPCLGVFGFAILNGSNLLDGLDSMQLKLASVSLFIFVFYGKYYQIAEVYNLAAFALGPLMAFYFFNREPAKIHMGEIGANTLGMLLLLLSVKTFIALTGDHTIIDAIAISAIPVVLPIIELAVSFSRRLIQRRSPFKSDQLHIHHILTEYKGLSAGGATTVLAISHLMISQTTLFIAYFSPTVGLVAAVISFSGAYVAIGYPVWFLRKGVVSKVLYSAKMTRLKRKKLKIISSHAIDDFQLVVTPLYIPNKEKKEYDIAS